MISCYSLVLIEVLIICGEFISKYNGVDKITTVAWLNINTREISFLTWQKRLKIRAGMNKDHFFLNPLFLTEKWVVKEIAPNLLTWTFQYTNGEQSFLELQNIPDLLKVYNEKSTGNYKLLQKLRRTNIMKSKFGNTKRLESLTESGLLMLMNDLRVIKKCPVTKKRKYSLSCSSSEAEESNSKASSTMESGGSNMVKSVTPRKSTVKFIAPIHFSNLRHLLSYISDIELVIPVIKWPESSHTETQMGNIIYNILIERFKYDSLLKWLEVYGLDWNGRVLLIIRETIHLQNMGLFIKFAYTTDYNEKRVEILKGLSNAVALEMQNLPKSSLEIIFSATGLNNEELFESTCGSEDKKLKAKAEMLDNSRQKLICKLMVTEEHNCDVQSKIATIKPWGLVKGKDKTILYNVNNLHLSMSHSEKPKLINSVINKLQLIQEHAEERLVELSKLQHATIADFLGDLSMIKSVLQNIDRKNISTNMNKSFNEVSEYKFCTTGEILEIPKEFCLSSGESFLQINDDVCMTIPIISEPDD